MKTTADTIEVFVRRTKAKIRIHRRTEKPDSIDTTAAILATCAMRTSLAPTKHLQRVILTHGILSAVRFAIRTLSQNALVWPGPPEVFQEIDKMSSDLAYAVLDAIENEDPTENGFFKDFFSRERGLLVYRTDLRFTAPMKGDAKVPFGPDFPEWMPSDLDRDVLDKICSDMYEMSSIGGATKLETVEPEKRDDVGLTNQLTFMMIFIALGKCVLSNWTAEQRTFLDMLACMEIDRDIARNEE